MRVSLKAILVLAAAVLGVFALVVFNPENRQQQEAPQPEAAAPSVEAGSPHEPATEQTASPGPAEVPAEVQAFIDSYADPDASDDEWGQSLAPNVTPALLASLLSSDRELARTAGHEILDVSDGRVSVGTKTDVSYTLEYAQLEDDHEHDGHEAVAHPIVTGIDFTDAPDGAALPLGTDGVEQVRAPVQEALTAVVAQPGGQSDEDREQLIRDTFTSPEKALSLPRSVDDGAAVRIGNAHELVLAAEDDQFVVHATVPYARDGESTPTWTTVTIELTRDDTGAWTPQDARL
ncbi:MAG TPA: hypothetical protein H9871_07090 [Candidatus Nesterenkonia stercoripullorum]|uniref:Uncharacterized protein n=1 Tax=Candidatus Nesterenkonia stercoripullorum TaxID=2838701 RepID=A0A9D1UT34_9MICC|nr:hypothetical protein [Candidatus Nesterenkonia stercoripullorum]